jgi:hypothetical protein
MKYFLHKPQAIDMMAVIAFVFSSIFLAPNEAHAQATTACFCTNVHPYEYQSCTIGQSCTCSDSETGTCARVPAPEMSDYLAWLFLAVGGGIIIRRQRKLAKVLTPE